MKREREDESEEEIFERRRKVHKQEKTAKNEIEDLFEHTSESTEESGKEEALWGVEEAAHAGILLEIFGNGTEYLHVLEALSKLQKEREEGVQKVKEAQSKAQQEIDAEKVIERAVNNALEKGCPLQRATVVQLAEDALNEKDAAESIKALFYSMDSPVEMFSAFQIRNEVEKTKETERVLKMMPKAGVKKTEQVLEYVHKLKNAAECSRLAKYLCAIESRTDKEIEAALRVTKLLLDAPDQGFHPAARPGTNPASDSFSRASMLGFTSAPTISPPKKDFFKGLLGNPWALSKAVEIGMDIGEVEIVSLDVVKVQTNRVSGTDMLLLQALKKRGLLYKISIDTESLYTEIVKKLGEEPLPEDIQQSVQYFVEHSSAEICKGIERALMQSAENTVQFSLFKKLFEIASLQSKKLGVLSFWPHRGKVKHTKIDAEENVVESGVQDRLPFSQDSSESPSSSNIFAVTGSGYKIKPYLKRKEKVFIPEEILLKAGLSKDLSNALCFFVKHSCQILENLLSAEGSLPLLVSFQEMLGVESMHKIWMFAISCAKARNAFFLSNECSLVKKDLLEYLRSGGNICSVDAPKYISIEEMRRAIKNTPAPHTSWIAPEEEAVIENQILYSLYKQCVRKIENTLFIPTINVDARAEFLAVCGIEEQALLSMETQWKLSSGAKISLAGPVYEGSVAFIGAETQVQLSNRVYATLRFPQKNLQVGQRSSFQVTDIDISQQRIYVQEKKEKGSTSSFSQSHWQIKKLSSKGAFRMLKDKPFGAYVIRPSSTHKNFLVLSVRITEKLDECICSHIHIKEENGRYEIEGCSTSSLSHITANYLPNYLSSLKKVILYKKFSTFSVERIKEDILSLSKKEIMPYAFSLSKTAPGAVSFVFAPKEGEVNEILLHCSEHGLFYRGTIFHRPYDFVMYIRKTVCST